MFGETPKRFDLFLNKFVWNLDHFKLVTIPVEKSFLWKKKKKQEELIAKSIENPFYSVDSSCFFAIFHSEKIANAFPASQQIHNLCINVCHKIMMFSY